MTPDSRLTAAWRAELELIKGAGLLRQISSAQSRSATTIEIAGRSLLNFSSNDYLGLSTHPRVVEAAQRAASQWGAGAGASRLVSGSLDLHRELEEALARFKGPESALVFSSGYLAALGLIQTLAVRRDATTIPVFFDRLSHACVVDAVRHCGAPWRTFAHNDPGALELLLKKAANRPRQTKASKSPSSQLSTQSSELKTSPPSAVVVTEGVFSMDGDMAPLPDLLAVCERWGAVLIVDDAHGTGTVGPGGRGSAAHFGLTADSPHLIQMGTLSKALGAQGGFVAGPEILTRLLVNRARAFIFDTALAPPSAAAALEALRIVQEEPQRVATLQANAVLLRSELQQSGTKELNETAAGGEDPPDLATPIIPLILGNAARTVSASRTLHDAGYLAIAIRPPTVPPGTSRLRLTVTASHTPEQILGLAREIGGAGGAPTES